MKNEYRDTDLKLTPKNKQVIKKIKYYLESHYLEEDYMQDIMSDIIGMALESQTRGEDFSETVGLDYEEFCRELVANSPRQTYIEKVFNKIISAVVCLGIVLPIMYLLGLIFRIPAVRCESIMLVAPLAFILKYMLMVFILHIGWELGKRSVYKSQTVIVGIYIASIVLAIILSDYISMIKQVYSITVEVNMLIWFAAFIAIVLVLYFLKARIVLLTNLFKRKINNSTKKEQAR